MPIPGNNATSSLQPRLHPRLLRWLSLLLSILTLIPFLFRSPDPPEPAHPILHVTHCQVSHQGAGIVSISGRMVNRSRVDVADIAVEAVFLSIASRELKHKTYIVGDGSVAGNAIVDFDFRAMLPPETIEIRARLLPHRRRDQILNEISCIETGK